MTALAFPARWPLWTEARPRWIGYALASEVAAVGVTAVSLAGSWDDLTDLRWFTVLLVLGIAQAEVSRQIEQRVRRWMSGQTHINVTSVWLLAGTVLLSPGWAALLAAALYAHLWPRICRGVSTRPTHRVVASTAWAMISCWTAAVTLHGTGLGGLASAPVDSGRAVAVIVVAALVFELVNLAAVAMSVCLYTRQRALTDVVGTWGENALELVTLCLGGLAAVALVFQPVLVLLIYPPLLLLQPHVLIERLEVAVATDEKTGLYNNAGWRHLADRELERARRMSTELAVFMVDIDHFKRVNDTYGHLAGDDVLRAVAATIGDTVRDYDTVGRFGGEEFVILLPDLSATDVHDVAERLRAAITTLIVSTRDGRATVAGLSVSIGTATYPATDGPLEALVHAADTALLRAKRTGRDRVAHADTPTAVEHTPDRTTA